MTNPRRFAKPVAIGAVLIALVVDWVNHPEPAGIDFHTYEAAALVGLHHGWSHIYDQGLVMAQQRVLDPGVWTQPYLSPPTVAWLAALLAPLPYHWAFYLWAGVTLVALVAAFAWSGTGVGLSRWVVAGAALAAWWVPHAVRLGQVVPLVAVGVVVAWRLLREERDVEAGLVLALVSLKPNTAFLVPIALLVAGRYRAFLAWCGAGAAIAAVALATLGPDGTSAYVGQLLGPLPPGANSLTLEGALGVGGLVATTLRVAILVLALAAAYRLRKSPGLVIAVGVLGSLLVAPYLHGSDLCLFGAAAWIVWEERSQTAWRAPLVVGWVLASPYLFLSPLGPGLNRWPLIEIGLFGALAVSAWRAGRAPQRPLTGEAEARTRATA